MCLKVCVCQYFIFQSDPPSVSADLNDVGHFELILLALLHSSRLADSQGKLLHSPSLKVPLALHFGTVVRMWTNQQVSIKTMYSTIQ